MPRLLVPMFAVLFAALLSGSASAAATTCDRYASPFGSDTAAGTVAAPFKTAQALADSLSAGQTGCLQGGEYTEEMAGPYVLRVGHGGKPGAPITIRSAPGQTATLHGIVYVPEGSDNVTLSYLHIIGQRIPADTANGVQVNAADTVFDHDDITDNQGVICMVLGSPGWGTAVRTVIQNSVFHDCGHRDGGFWDNKLHSIYVDLTQGVLITNNLFLRTSAYAVHLYPYASGTTVTHNVMVDNGGGIIFAGSDDAGSSNNFVSQNIVVGTETRPGIHSWWDAAKGTGNVADSNCLDNNDTANVDISEGGFTAQHNSIADPDFVDPAHGDYRLKLDSPCLSVVGYDSVARMEDDPVTPPASTATPTATATATATKTPAPTATPTKTATPDPTKTVTPDPTKTPTPEPTKTSSPDPTETPAATGTATPAATVPSVSQEPVTGSPAKAPTAPVEAAHEIDTHAFSFSGGTPVGKTKK